MFTFCLFPGLESLRDSGHSTPVRSITHGDPLLRSYSNFAEGKNRASEISEELYRPTDSVLTTPVSSNCSLDQALCQHMNSPPSVQEEKKPEAGIPASGRLVVAKFSGRVYHLGKIQTPTGSMEVKQVSKVIGSLARLFLVTLTLLLALLLLLIALTESELDVAFLRDIRQTAEFQQFHNEYFCPLRRWLAYKLRWM